VDEAAYRERFLTSAWDDFATEIGQLRAAGCIKDSLRLTPEGLAWSDGIGPLLFSSRVRAAMRAYELR
jgi:oxygen-independent coproporphyrinogen-3 oxidase